MGTNFYLIERDAVPCVDDPRVHVGKRSGAGLYCWDCDEMLGERDDCPQCSATAAMGSDRREGVSKACSFTWGMSPRKVRKLCLAGWHRNIIVDEHGEKFTGAAFLELLDEICPIQITSAVGTRFS
jgi:hypothetical protein